MSNIISDSDSESETDTPHSIIDAVNNISADILPKKSGRIYRSAYEKFVVWKKERKVEVTTESAMLVYFTEFAKTVVPPSLWSVWSMLKTTIINHEKININSYAQLKAFIVKENKGYEVKKAKILKNTEITRFLTEFSDNEYLLKKVVMIIGISGACRRDELYKITSKDVEDYNTFFKINLPKTKSDKPRSFIVENEFYGYVKKYIALRPKNATAPNFFMRYQKGKCVNQVVGVHTIGSTPKEIARALGLEKPELYTGHAFRRSSAALYVDSGFNVTKLKRSKGSKSDEVADNYVVESVTNKRIKEEVCDLGGNVGASSSDRDQENDYAVDVGASTSDRDKEYDYAVNVGVSTSAMKLKDDLGENVYTTTPTSSFKEIIGETLPSPTHKITANPISLCFINCTFQGPTNFEAPK